MQEATISQENNEHQPNLAEMACAIKVLSMDAVEKANSGHPGMPMGMADVATVLFTEFLKFDPQNPDWPDRDRFVLSAGHGSMLLYSLLYLTGYKDITIEEIKNFRQLGAKTAGHPEYGHAAGIETTTGPLGQGLANAVGMAISEKITAARFGEDIINHDIYVIAGDGCLMEGISQEAISLAGHLKLDNLIVLFDDNNISIDGTTDLTTSDNQIERFKASHWFVQEIDGHNPEIIRSAIKAAKNIKLPSLIACKTIIAKDSPTKAGTSSSHGAPLGEDEIKGARKNLGWDYPPFEIPEHILNAWRSIGTKSAPLYKEWKHKLEKLEKNKKHEFERVISGKLPESFNHKVNELKQNLVHEQKNQATRKSSGEVLEILTSVMPELIGGSADLTGSNNTKTSLSKPITKEDFSGNYIHYGVREHAMAAIMNGMALSKGTVPYGGTFLVFTDYCRPAIRLAALMKQKVIFVMTHDSIGLGEDGPTHQPVEHLASLRAIPDLQVLRPADAVETLECWQLALTYQGPSILALSRQSLPSVRKTFAEDNTCALGGYILSPSDTKSQVSLIATGSEIGIALEAQTSLKEKNIAADVVSMVCTSLFDKQDNKYKKKVLPEDTLKVVIEAGVQMNWDKYLGENGVFIGMHGFGASAPAKDLYRHFGITTEEIVKHTVEKLEKVVLFDKDSK